MTDDLEPALRALLASRATATDAEVAALLEDLATLPRRRPRRGPVWLAAAAGVVVAVGTVAGLGLAWVLGTARLGPVAPGTEPPVTVPSPSATGGPSGGARLEVSLAEPLDGSAEGVHLELRRDGDPIERTDGWGGTATFVALEPARYELRFWIAPCGTACDDAEPVDVCDAIFELQDGERWRASIVRRLPLPCRIDLVRVAPPGSGSPAPGASATAAAQVPAWATGLRAQLECDGPTAAGYERGERPPAGHEGTASPYPWLEGLDAFDLPLSGYAEAPLSRWEFAESAFARYEYRAAGRTRAVILMEGHSVQGGPGSWDVTAFAACAPSEFAPADGRTTDDLPLLDHDGRAAADVRIGPGPAHCDWQSTTWLWIGDRLFLRDPLRVLPDAATRELRTLARVPVGAVDARLSSARWHLYTGSGDAVWMVAADGTVEEWPSATAPGCV